MVKFASAAGWSDPQFPNVLPFDPGQMTSVDAASVRAIIYATGYRPAFSDWLPWPEAFDGQGFPIQVDGSSTVIPGLHFLRIKLLRHRKSSLLAGVGEDASIVAKTVSDSQNNSDAA